jgi:rRNA processing protein Krr1/Pno1
MTVQKKKKPKPEELEKGKKAAPVEKTDMKVTGKSIGAIIGPKGINLQAIQSACDVTISIPKDRKPGKDDPVTISIEGGTADSRQSARANIQSLIDNGYSKITHGPDFTMQTFSVDGKKLGQVIGHKGETVQAIQNASGAKINTSNGSNVISIVGTRDRVQSARQIIDELINDGYSNALLKDGAVRQEVVYPRPLLGRLIGKNGANTKRIQKETRTKIVIPDPGSDNQNIVVFGTPADVERAAALILETLKVEKKPAAEGEEEEDEMAGWTAPVSGDDAWDAADRAGPADGWSSLVPQPGSAW